MLTSNRLLTVLGAATLLCADPALAASPGLEAIKEHKTGSHTPDSVQNRFFLKEGRFELAPAFGYVPNNPFAQRFVGSLIGAYHFSETLAAEGRIAYSPDLGKGDLKPLLSTLIVIANTGSSNGANFEQPLEKDTLSFSAAVRWTPLYGKINLVGETVLNFDFYGVAGLGMLSKTNYVATYNGSLPPTEKPLDLASRGNEVKVAPVLGVGINFFANQSLALKLDMRSSLYLDNVPDYDPDTPAPTDDDTRLFNELTASIGLCIFIPKMKPRLYNF
jgi:outer membrane beta-barrel protein